MIPTGVAEEIYVQFTPAQNEYKYYYDSVRIHCEGDKILIPIHAFPVINSKQDELFPSFIEMGKALTIGKSYQKKLQIESNCPVNFEYMIKVTKPHPDISISPLVGDVLGLQTTSIDFEYVPKSYSTAEAEIEVRTTEFDSQPKTIRVTGSATPKQGEGLTEKKRNAMMSQANYAKFEASGAQTPLNVIYEEDQMASRS